MKIFVALLVLTLAWENVMAGRPIYASHDYEWDLAVVGCLHGIEDSSNKRQHRVTTLKECLGLCVDEAEFVCLSMTFISTEGLCTIVDVNSEDFLESNLKQPCPENPAFTYYAERRLKDCRPTDGWTEFEGNCYKVVGGPSGEADDWEVVREACKQSNVWNRRVESEFYLANVTSAEENSFIANDLLGGERAWIGASKRLAFRDDGRCGGSWEDPVGGEVAKCDPNGRYPCCSQYEYCGITHDHCRCSTCVDYRGSPTGDFYWDNQEGAPFLSISDGYTNWNREQPSNNGGDEDCVEINRGPLGAWNDLPCRRPRRGVCKFSTLPPA